MDSMPQVCRPQQFVSTPAGCSNSPAPHHWRQHLPGFRLWSPAIGLAHWIMHNRCGRVASCSSKCESEAEALTCLLLLLCIISCHLVGKTVLEVACGLGLGGLVAAHFASRVVLTDFEPAVLRQVSYNVRCNKLSADQGTAQLTLTTPHKY